MNHPQPSSLDAHLDAPTFAMSRPYTSLIHELLPALPLTTPAILGAPMRLVSGPSLTHQICISGGLGFLGLGYDLSNADATISSTLSLFETSPSKPAPNLLPFGIGFLLWKLNPADVIALITKHRPSCVWYFAPRTPEDLPLWIKETKAAAPWCRIFVQLSSVPEAIAAIEAGADVIVAQGTDAGGHGLAGNSVGTLALVREMVEHPLIGRRVPIIGAGGIVDGRGVAAILVAGAEGVALGTRFLASQEAEADEGWKRVVIEGTGTGGKTVRTRVYDVIRGTGDWPEIYNGRCLVNRTLEEVLDGVEEEKVRERYQKAVEEGDYAWITSFA